MPFQIFILIALSTMATISPSSGGSKDPATIALNLKRFCSDTNADSTKCWKIIKPQLSKFKSTDPKVVATVMIDLAKGKGDQLRQQLDRLQQVTKDKKSKDTYAVTSSCYGDVGSSLDMLKARLETNDHRTIDFAVVNAVMGLESCWFNGGQLIKDSFKEYEVYMHMVEVAVYLLIDGHPLK